MSTQEELYDAALTHFADNDLGGSCYCFQGTH